MALAGLKRPGLGLDSGVESRVDNFWYHLQFKCKKNNSYNTKLIIGLIYICI